MNLYEQQAVESPQDVADHGRRSSPSCCCSASASTRSIIGAAGGSVPIGSIVALGVGSVSALASYFRGDRAVLRGDRAPADRGASRPRRTTTSKLKLRQLENVVDEMAIAAGSAAAAGLRRSRPRSECVRDRPRPGARIDRGHARPARRARSRGAAGRRRARDEPHPQLDIRVMTVVAALVGAVALLSDWARRGMWWGGGARRDATTIAAAAPPASLFSCVWLVAIMLAPLVAQMLAMMVSRRREYLADASGAELTRNPLGLASALEKIEAAVEPTRAINAGTAHLCIADPLGRRMSVERALVGSVRLASADGRAHRGAEGDGVPTRRVALHCAARASGRRICGGPSSSRSRLLNRPCFVLHTDISGSARSADG